MIHIPKEARSMRNCRNFLLHWLKFMLTYIIHRYNDNNNRLQSKTGDDSNNKTTINEVVDL